MQHWLVSLFARYGYATLFAGVYLENVGIPVPGETVLLAAGFFARQHALHLSLVIPCAIIAAILGDNTGYWIGRRGGRTLIERRGRYIGLTTERVSHAERYFRDHGPRTIFFARFVSGLRVVAAISAGVAQVPWRTFLLYNTAGAIAWATIIALLGYLFGQSWALLEHRIGEAGIVLIALVAAALVLFVLRKHRVRIASWIAKRLPANLTLREAWLLATSLLFIGLLGKIIEDVVTRESTPFDDSIATWIASIHSPLADVLFHIANALGSSVLILAASIVMIVWCLRRGDRRAAVSLAAIVLSTELLDVLVNLAIERSRPASLHAGRFPSGHAANAVAVYGFIAFLIARERPRMRRVLFVAAALIALLAGFARMYFKLHWTTDVLGGWCLGLLLLGIAVFRLERNPNEI